MALTALRLLCAALVCAAVQVYAQNYPLKPVKLIVPTPAGTSPDVIGRFLSDRLTRVLGPPVVVENVVGAGGLIASQTAARAPADGYTLYFAGTGALITDRYTQKSLGYDPDRDFVLISMIYEEGSLAIAVHPDVPARTLPEFIQLARSQPGKLSYSTTSVALLILFGEWFQKQAGVAMVAVPYKSAAQQFQDTIAGRTHMLISAPPQLEPFRKAGKLRVLAVDGARRYPPWPDVPNIYETLPGWRMSGMGVMAAPRGVQPQ
jgi:tripartite-type tricarboxylate transporter receptor subunit TctC